MNSLHKTMALLAMLVGLVLPVPALALPFTGLYVFGDSLADSGNNAAVFDVLAGPGVLRTPTPLPGPLVPTYPYAPSGTYSNGRVWVDYLADSLGLGLAPSMLGGTNYAFGGARTGPQSGSGFPYSLREQVDLAFGGAGASAPGGALYVVEGGGNDARDVLGVALAGGNPDQLIADYASNIATILSTLSAKGANHFLLWNVPDIGKIPSVAAFGPAVSAAASGLVGRMNQALQLALGQLPGDVTDGLHFFDAFQAFNDVVANPGDYGFSDVTGACATSAACIADPTGVLFWDGIHPTTAGHQLLARLTLAELPEPSTYLLFGLALLAMAMLRRKTG